METKTETAEVEAVTPAKEIDPWAVSSMKLESLSEMMNSMQATQASLQASMENLQAQMQTIPRLTAEELTELQPESEAENPLPMEAAPQAAMILPPSDPLPEEKPEKEARSLFQRRK